MGSAVATAMLGVMLDIGDKVNRELRSVGANIVVTAQRGIGDRRQSGAFRPPPAGSGELHPRSPGAQHQDDFLGA